MLKYCRAKDLPSTISEQLEDNKKDAYQTTTHHLSNKSTNYPTKPDYQINYTTPYTCNAECRERQRHKNLKLYNVEKSNGRENG